MNLGFLGKGNASRPEALSQQIAAGAIGLKLHEDWGTTPAAIDCCLARGRGHRHAGRRSTPTRSTRAASSRTPSPRSRAAPSTPSTPKAPAAATRPTSCKRGRRGQLPALVAPTRRMPYTVNTVDEHLDMLMVCHHLDAGIAEDLAFAESRIRRETIAAEDVLHDLGAISMMSSDSQAMGRVGEVIIRTWQTAHKMKVQRGALRRATATAQRQLPRQALHRQVHHQPGASPTASRTRWAASRSASGPTWCCGSRPSSASSPAWCSRAASSPRRAMGDPNASIPTPQPVHYRPMFGSFGGALPATSLTFVSQAALARRHRRRARPAQAAVGRCSGCRTRAARRDMVHNAYLPVMEIDAQTYEVRADGAAAHLRAGHACCRWRSATSCSERTPDRPMLTVNKLVPQGRGLAAVLLSAPPTRRARLGRAPEEPLRRHRLQPAAGSACSCRAAPWCAAATCWWPRTARWCACWPRRSRCWWCAPAPSTARPCDLLRAAYHLGNRHVPLELQPDHLKLEPDHVLARDAAAACT